MDVPHRFDEDVHRQAHELIRKAYEDAAQMQHVSITRINRARPPSLRYRSRREIVREFLTAAGAISTFAVNVGLIPPSEAAQILRDFSARHPEIDESRAEQEWFREFEREVNRTVQPDSG